MELEGFTALPEFSRKAQTTVDRARYWLKLLNVETIKKGNVRYVPNSCLPILSSMARMISEGATPTFAAQKAREETPAGIVQVAPGTVQDNRLESIEKALLAVAEKMNFLVEENRALRLEVSSLQKSLEFKKTEEISQTRLPDPRRVEKKIPGILEKVWLKIHLFFHPEQMRQNCEP